MAFVSTRPYVSLLREINKKEIRIEKRRYLAKPYLRTHIHTQTHNLPRH